MRGLKLFTKPLLWKWSNVASYIDAWIEITGAREDEDKDKVASYIDAWIEI